MMTAPTYKNELSKQCNKFLRSKNPVRMIIKDGVEVEYKLTERETLLEKLRDLGVETYKKDDG